MKSLNKVMLMGHLAADVDLRQTKKGIVVASFPLAINKMVQSEEGKVEAVDFYKIVAWRQLAELCSKYLAKGIAVYVEGKLSNQSFEDKDGKRHFRTEIVANDINFLTWKKSKNGIKEAVELEPILKEE